MWYVVSYVSPFGRTIYNFLNEDEYRTLMVPCTVLFSSNDISEAAAYYHSRFL